jgi:hypothetical protein
MAEQQAHQDEQSVDIKALREAADRAKALEREVTELRRDRAFRQAGIDPDDKKVSYFVKGYEGELDPNAIRKEAQEAGFLPEPGPTSEQQQSLAGQGRIEQVVATSQPQGGQEYEAQLEQAFAEGGTAGLVQAAASLGIPLNDD